MINCIYDDVDIRIPKNFLFNRLVGFLRKADGFCRLTADPQVFSKGMPIIPTAVPDKILINSIKEEWYL